MPKIRSDGVARYGSNRAFPYWGTGSRCLVFSCIAGDVDQPDLCSRDFDIATVAHMCQAETSPDQSAIAEQCPYFLRVRVSGNIEVFGMQSEECITHTSAHQKGLKSRLVQPIKDF